MPLKNAKAKGTKAEHKTRKVLELAGYYCLRAGGSLGAFDLVAIGATDLRCIQVKAGARGCSPLERESMQLVTLPPYATREIWRWKTYARQPLIERL